MFNIATNNSNAWATLIWISGGKLNMDKCFYYFLQPKYNFNTNSIKYLPIHKTPGDITINNPSTSTPQMINRIEPHVAKRTLGVLLAPDGNSREQLKKSHEMAHAYLNRFCCSRLNKHTKWTAIHAVMEPAVLYPLMACSCTNKEMSNLDKIISKAKCHALGLNKHFPRAVLHGPLSLGGMAVHTAQTKTTTSRINYFLFHTRMDTTIGAKLDASTAFLQLEIGTLDHFLQTPFNICSVLATDTLMKCIWKETEPFGLTLRHATNQIWNPSPQGDGDFSITEFALTVYSKKFANKINRVRL
jgi:hypothetical protein